jgi:hypothetical protein
MILKKTQLAKGQPEPRRQIPGSVRTFHKIGRRRFRLEISPALKRLCRTWLDEHEGWVQNQGCAGAAVRPLVGSDVQNGLAALQLPGDNPVDGAAVKDFSRALRPLPRPVQERRVSGQARCLHITKMLDITDTDGEFDEVEHLFRC